MDVIKDWRDYSANDIYIYIYVYILMYLINEGKVKIYSLAYNRRETRDKKPLDRDTTVAGVTYTLGDSFRVCCRSVYGSMGCGQESYTLVWL